MTSEPQITFRHMDPIPTLETEILDEIAGLERFFDRITACRVTITGSRAHRYSGLYDVRIDLTVPRDELVVEHTTTLHSTLQSMGVSRRTKQFEPKRNPRDPKMAVHDAFREMRRRLQDYVRRMRRETKEHEPQLLEGTVTSLFPDHGFLQTPDGREIYFHQNSVLEGHFDRLRIGTGVRFSEENGEKGAQASTVKLLHPTRQAREAAKSVPVRPMPAKRAG